MICVETWFIVCFLMTIQIHLTDNTWLLASLDKTFFKVHCEFECDAYSWY